LKFLVFPALNDPWLDNGLEVLHKAIKDIKTQHKGVLGKLLLEPDRLAFEILEEEYLLDLLDKLFENWFIGRLHYWSEKRGEKKLVLKQFVTFNRQPQSQFPKLFIETKRRELIRNALTPPSKDGELCPVCGAGSKQWEKLTLSVHPMATKIKSLSGVRTRITDKGLKGLSEHFRICPRCYLRGALAWLDNGLIYRTFIGRRLSAVLVPAPLNLDLSRLSELKDRFRRQLRLQDGRSNVKVIIRRGKQVVEESPPAENSILLAFLERLLHDILAEVKGSFLDVRRSISEGWQVFVIPIGPLKNVVAKELILDDPTIRLLKDCVEVKLRPYQDIIASMWLVDERTNRFITDEVDELREKLSKAVLENDFSSFASLFVPRPRRNLAYRWETEESMEKFVEHWRRNYMDEERLGVIKKVGRALAQISAERKSPTLLYALERARSPKDLLEVLSQASHRLIGLEADKLQYISLEGLEKLTDILSEINLSEFREVKNTLMIFAGLEWARRIRRNSAQQ